MCLKAFVIGGAVCAVGQLLLDRTRLTPGKILVIFLMAGLTLGGFGVYDYIVGFAGAGATVPISGFGSLLAAGAREAVKEKGLLGIFTGGLTAASAGLSAAIGFGFLAALFFRPRRK